MGWGTSVLVAVLSACVAVWTTLRFQALLVPPASLPEKIYQPLILTAINDRDDGDSKGSTAPRVDGAGTATGLAERKENQHGTVAAVIDLAQALGIGRVLLARGQPEEAALAFRVAATAAAESTSETNGNDTPDGSGRRTQAAEANHGLGLALRAAGRPIEALTACRAAERLDPGLAAASVCVGALLTERGDSAGAVAALRRAAFLEQDGGEAQGRLGAALLAAGEVEEAILVLVQALEVDKMDAHSAYNLGVAWQSKGDTNKAIGAYARAVDLTPALAPARVNLGAQLLKRGQLRDAEAMLLAAVSVGDDAASRAAAYSNLGAVLEKSGRTEEALEAYGQAVDWGAGRAGLVHMARLHQDLGQLEQALDASQRALVEGVGDPMDVSPLMQAGMILESLGRIEEAANHFSTATDVDVHNLEANVHLGNCQRRLGRHHEALESFLKASQLDPKNAEVYKLLHFAVSEAQTAAGGGGARNGVDSGDNFSDSTTSTSQPIEGNSAIRREHFDDSDSEKTDAEMGDENERVSVLGTSPLDFGETPREHQDGHVEDTVRHRTTRPMINEAGKAPKASTAEAGHSSVGMGSLTKVGGFAGTILPFDAEGTAAGGDNTCLVEVTAPTGQAMTEIASSAGVWDSTGIHENDMGTDAEGGGSEGDADGQREMFEALDHTIAAVRAVTESVSGEAGPRTRSENCVTGDEGIASPAGVLPVFESEEAKISELTLTETVLDSGDADTFSKPGCVSIGQLDDDANVDVPVANSQPETVGQNGEGGEFDIANAVRAANASGAAARKVFGSKSEDGASVDVEDTSLAEASSVRGDGGANTGPHQSEMQLSTSAVTTTASQEELITVPFTQDASQLDSFNNLVDDIGAGDGNPNENSEATPSLDIVEGGVSATIEDELGDDLPLGEEGWIRYAGDKPETTESIARSTGLFEDGTTLEEDAANKKTRSDAVGVAGSNFGYGTTSGPVQAGGAAAASVVGENKNMEAFTTTEREESGSVVMSSEEEQNERADASGKGGEDEELSDSVGETSKPTEQAETETDPETSEETATTLIEEALDTLGMSGKAADAALESGGSPTVTVDEEGLPEHDVSAGDKASGQVFADKRVDEKTQVAGTGTRDETDSEKSADDADGAAVIGSEEVVVVENRSGDGVAVDEDDVVQVSEEEGRRARSKIKLGLAHLQHGKAKKAAALFDKATSIDPHWWEGYYYSAVARDAMGDAEAAAGALISALQVLTPTEGARTSQLTALASNVLAALEGGKDGSEAATIANDLKTAMATAGLEFTQVSPQSPNSGASREQPRAPMEGISTFGTDTEGIGRTATMGRGAGRNTDGTLEADLATLEKARGGASRERGGIGSTQGGIDLEERLSPFGRHSSDGTTSHAGSDVGGAGGGARGGAGGRQGVGIPTVGGSSREGGATVPGSTREPVWRSNRSQHGAGGDASPPTANASHGFSGGDVYENQNFKRPGGTQQRSGQTPSVGEEGDQSGRGSKKMRDRGNSGGSSSGRAGQSKSGGDGVGLEDPAMKKDAPPNSKPDSGGGGRVGWGVGGARRRAGPWSAQERGPAQAAAAGLGGENGQPVIIDSQASAEEIIASMGLNRDISLGGMGGVGRGTPVTLSKKKVDEAATGGSSGVGGAGEEDSGRRDGGGGNGIGGAFRRLFKGRPKNERGSK